jgi:hypothetical protein
MPAPRTQRWHLIGLVPMHDALIRRLAIQERELTNRIQGVDVNIEWSASPRLESWRVWTQPEPIDITIIHRDQLLDAIERLGAFDRSQFLVRDSDWRMRLLWSWFPFGKHDVSWGTHWLAAGAICGPRTLQSWIRVANRKGSLGPRPPHTLLRELKLPTL